MQRSSLLIALILSLLGCSFGCGSNEAVAPKPPEEIKKEHINRAERMRQDNSAKK